MSALKFSCLRSGSAEEPFIMVMTGNIPGYGHVARVISSFTPAQWRDAYTDMMVLWHEHNEGLPVADDLSGLIASEVKGNH